MMKKSPWLHTIGYALVGGFWVLCAFLSIFHTHGKYSQASSLWEITRQEILFQIPILLHQDPYWTTFRSDCPNVVHDSLVVNLPHGATIYQALWLEEDGVTGSITYYQDRKNNRLMVYLSGDPTNMQPIPYDAWHYIHPNGLIRFDWVTLMANMCFILLVFATPWLALFFQFTHKHNNS